MAKKKPAPYRIVMRVKNSYVFSEENKVEEVNKWIDKFNNSADAVEMSIYQQENEGYDLVAYENKRKIGF